MYCKKCGAQIADDADFCQKCGTKQSAETISSKETPVEQLASSIGQIQMNNMNKTLRLPVIIVLVLTMLTPFYKIFSIPIAETISSYYFKDIGIDTSFSFIGYAKLLFFITKEGGDVSIVLYLPVIIYSIILLGVVLAFYNMVNLYKENYEYNVDFWRYSKSANRLMVIDNIFLAAAVHIMNVSLRDETLPITIDIFKVNTLLYVILGVNIVLWLLSENQFKSASELYEKGTKLSSSAKKDIEKKVSSYSGTWTCSSCGDVNPTTTKICRGCGKYK